MVDIKVQKTYSQRVCPKTPAGTSSQKRDQRNEEDSSSSISSSSELVRRESDIGSSSGEENERLDVSQVDQIELREDATNGKVGKQSAANIAFAVAAGTKTHKEIENVSGSAEEGKSSAVALVADMEYEDLDGDQGNSTENQWLESERMVSGTLMIDDKDSDESKIVEVGIQRH